MLKLIRVPFYYLRHGQTDWNVENRAMGQTDIPLNNHGIHQAMSSRNQLINAEISTICYSPLLRAKQTAEIYNEVLNCDLVAIEELMEFNLGPFSGKQIGEWFEEWRSGAQLEGVELYTNFMKRCIKGINKALSLPGLVLIIAHGGVFWSIEYVTQVQLSQDLPNCAPVFHLPPKGENEKWQISLV